MENNPLIQHHQKSVSSYLRAFRCPNHIDFSGPITCDSCYKGSHSLIFLLRDRIAFWESEIQRMEGMKQQYRGPDDSLEQHYEGSGFNSAIDVMLKPYREAIIWAKAELK